LDTQWQVQEAKQRFSEVLRRAQSDGPQFVTRHGTPVAVVLDIEAFHKLSGARVSFVDYLLSGPKTDDAGELIPDRSNDLPREIDLSDLG